MEAAPSIADFNILLTDGSAAHVREIRSSDAELLREFHARLSARSIAFRYLGPHPALSDKEVARFTNVDRIDRVALVVERAGRIVAVARYDRPPGSEEAEVAFVVQDELQGRGLGTTLLEQLAIIARRHGIRRFLADTFSENRRMLGVFRDSGFARRYSRSSEVVQVVLDIVPTPEGVAAADVVEQPSPVTLSLEPRPGACRGARPRSGPGRIGLTDGDPEPGAGRDRLESTGNQALIGTSDPSVRESNEAALERATALGQSSAPRVGQVVGGSAS